MTQSDYKKNYNLINDINSILKKHGIDNTINLSDIAVGDNTVSDLIYSDSVLSNLITNSIWPSINSLTVYHYTSKESAESILNNGEFRLYTLLKRFNELEIKTFCENHELNGYLDCSDGVPWYKNLMDNMYYASFTDTNLTVDDEQYFWRTFASIEGVRLKIKVTTEAPNFRKMVYETSEGKPLALLNEIAQCTQNKYGKKFVLSRISSLCAFYLAKEFEVEKEYRVLYRRWGETVQLHEDDRGFKYISVPIGQMSKVGYQFDIEEIQSDVTLNIPCQCDVVPRTRENI